MRARGRRPEADKKKMVTEEKDKSFLGDSLGAIFKDQLCDWRGPDFLGAH